MNEILSNILMMVLVAVVPTISAVIVSAIKNVTNSLVEKSKSEITDKILIEISDCAQSAVLYVSQTYVDTLKAAGTFDDVAQKKALAMALAALTGSLTQSAKDFIVENFGDLTTYLTGRIEAEVKRQKLIA